MVLDDQYAAFTFERRALAEEGQDGRIVRRVGRVEKGYAPRQALAQRCLAQELYRITTDNFDLPLRDFAPLQVRFDEAANLRRAFNESHVRCAARQGFQSRRARTGSEVKEQRI